jgi:hypothetical protein
MSSGSLKGFWLDACNYAKGKPLQTLLDAAYASCSLTVTCASAAAAAALFCAGLDAVRFVTTSRNRLLLCRSPSSA